MADEFNQISCLLSIEATEYLISFNNYLITGFCNYSFSLDTRRKSLRNTNSDYFLSLDNNERNQSNRSNEYEGIGRIQNSLKITLSNVYVSAKKNESNNNNTHIKI